MGIQAFTVREFPDQSFARRIVNPRRGPVLGVPGLGWRDVEYVRTPLFARFGLTEYNKSTTGEMYSRPVPHAFESSKLNRIRELYAKHAPKLFRRILPMVKPPVQPLNKVSRLGWPNFNVPESKKETVQPVFDHLLHDGLGDSLRGAWVIMNVRLQEEAADKERDFLFVSKDGWVYERKIGPSDRVIRTPVGPRLASRTRLVFNEPVHNLIKQILDTAIHNTLLTFPIWHHNMYGDPAASFRGAPFILALDVKHMERFTAAAVAERARIIGGLYEELQMAFLALPYLCPSDDWKRFFLLYPDLAAGWMVQFASGDSAVAPSQKELFFCLFLEFALTYLKMDEDSAITWVLEGGDARVRILNYGDDNFFAGEETTVRALYSFLQGWLEVQEEQPPAFLGFNFVDGKFQLRLRSYLVKTYMPERRPGSAFRPYPFFGWREKRRTYGLFGDAALQGSVFPTEDRLLDEVGLPWSRILQLAQEEEKRIYETAKGMALPDWVLGKDYLLTAEQKLATGLYEGWSSVETQPMLKRLLGSHWQ